MRTAKQVLTHCEPVMNMIKLHLHLKQAKGKLGKKHLAVLSILLELKTLGLFSILFPIPPPLDVITDFFSQITKFVFFVDKNLGNFLNKYFFSVDSTNLLIIWKFSPKNLYHILN
jgi:hypothetical protein